MGELLEVRWSADAVFDRAAARLARFPRSGRSGLMPATRELLPHPSYRLVYADGEDALTILAVIHTARQWPPLDDEAC